jgi:beta-lactamase regulating signal transducer with metallopeptidase domain
MTTELIQALVEINLAAGAAIALMLLVRKWAHGVIGARAVYLLWAIVPIAILATFIPSRTVETPEPTFPDRVVVTAYIPREGIDWVGIGLAVLVIVWAVGAARLAISLAKRQAMFDREADRGKAGPAVVGFAYPYIVTPKDFSDRFSAEERKLILVHEQVHLERRDPRVNALTAFIRCVCWFNPLAHVGASVLRIDQELACDAEVIERRPNVRRAYAETLLKTQLVSQPLPVGCYWPPETAHPLTERIAMLARTPLSQRRRIVASCAVMAFAAFGGVAAWAAQPERTVLIPAIDLLVPFEPIARDETVEERLALNRIDTEPAPP